eukprot:5095869-Amphidinium_carterae.2
MDGFNPNSGVLFLAATNRPEAQLCCRQCRIKGFGRAVPPNSSICRFWMQPCCEVAALTSGLSSSCQTRRDVRICLAGN